jgi:Asp-tRNA(Asn)/Glu-tRNA(Gln) amidotransferase A subunit family amidase
MTVNVDEVSAGSPVGLMLIGKASGEPIAYRAAHPFEQAADWKKM